MSESPLKRFKSFDKPISKNIETPNYEYKQVSPDSLKRKRVCINEESNDWKDDDEILSLVLAVAKWSISTVPSVKNSNKIENMIIG